MSRRIGKPPFKDVILAEAYRQGLKGQLCFGAKGSKYEEAWKAGREVWEAGRNVYKREIAIRKPVARKEPIRITINKREISMGKALEPKRPIRVIIHHGSIKEEK